MATVKWRGDAKGVSQVDVQQITGTPAAGSTYSVTCNGKTLTYTVPASVVSGFTQDMIDGLIALWTANANQQDGIAEFTEVALTQYATDKFAFTAITPGVPFTFTYGAGGGATQTNDATNSVAGTGPKDAANVANYDAGALPSAGDDLWFDDASNGPEFNVTALSAIGLGNVYFTPNFKGRVGRAPRVVAGRSTYIEYREQYLKLKSNSSSSKITVNSPSDLIKLNTQTFQFSLFIENTGSSNQNDGSPPAFIWKGTHASNAMVVDRGNVGIAYYPAETATLTTLRMGYIDSQDTDAYVIGGYGLTLTTLTKTGGKAIFYNTVTTIKQHGGETTLNAGSATTVITYAGTFNYAGSGTITAITVFPGAVATFNQSNQTRTCTDVTVYPDCTWNDPGGSVTHTNAISVPGGSPTQVKGTFGAGRSSAISFV